MLLRSPNVYKFNWTYSGKKTVLCKWISSPGSHTLSSPPPSPLANIVAKKPLWTSELVVPVPLHRSVVYFIFLRHVFRFKSYVLLNPPAYFRVWYVVPVFFCLSSMKPLLSHLIVGWCWVLTSSFTCKPFEARLLVLSSGLYLELSCHVPSSGASSNTWAGTSSNAVGRGCCNEIFYWLDSSFGHSFRGNMVPIPCV